MGYAIWTLNYFLMLNEIEEKIENDYWRFEGSEESANSAKHMYEMVIRPILLVCFILDLLIVIRIT